VAAGWIGGAVDQLAFRQLETLDPPAGPQLAVSILFPLLAADVSWGGAQPARFRWRGLRAGLMLVVRPLGHGIATAGPYRSACPSKVLCWPGWPQAASSPAAVAACSPCGSMKGGVPGAGQLQRPVS